MTNPNDVDSLFVISVTRDDGRQFFMCQDDNGPWFSLGLRFAAFFKSEDEAKEYFATGVSYGVMHGAAGCWNDQPVRKANVSLHRVQLTTVESVDTTVTFNVGTARRVITVTGDGEPFRGFNFDH